MKEEIQEVINMLDESYGEARNIGKDLGEYALIIEEDEDINKCSKLGIAFCYNLLLQKTNIIYLAI